MKQANRAGRPWQRADGRWAARAYPPDGGKPVMVYGKTETEVIERQHEAEIRHGVSDLPPEIGRASADLPPRPEKPVRFTLDLDRERHRYLKQYAAQIEASASEIIRELLDQMRADDDLRARVRARIWAQAGGKP